MRYDKTMVLERQSALATKMQEGLGYQREYEWYYNMYRKSEKTFQADRTIIHKHWKIAHNADMEIKKIELLQRIQADRELARSLGDSSSALSADKLNAQIEGFLNKQGEMNILIQKQYNVSGYTQAERDALRAIAERKIQTIEIKSEENK